MSESESENVISRVVFALFLTLVFSLALMKPGVTIGSVIVAPTDLIFPIVALACVVAIVTGKMRFVWHRAYWALLVYFVALALSAIFSTRPQLSVIKLTGESYLLLLAVLTANLVTTLERLRLVCFAWIAGALVSIFVAVVGIVLFYLSPGTHWLADITYHYGAAPFGNYPRINSTFVSPSMFCNYLTVTFALVTLAEVKDWIGRWVAVMLLIAISICAAFTVSITLGGLFFLAALLAFKLFPNSIASKLALLAGTAAAMVLTLTAPISLTTGGMSSRMLVWMEAIGRFIENPVFGSGLGTAAASVQYQNSDGTWSILTDAHNTFLNVAVQSGVVGLFGLLLVIIFVVLAVRVKDRSDKLFPIRVSLLVAFVAAFLFDSITGSFENARHLWVLVGLMLAVDGIDGEVKSGSGASARYHSLVRSATATS